MTAKQYRAAIAALGLSQVGAARFLGVGDRTSRRWAAGDEIPEVVELLLDMMIKHGFKPEDVKKKAKK